VAKTCFIEGIDPDLYKDFKSACAWFDLSIKEVLTSHMQNIVHDYLVARKIHDKPKIYTHKKGKKK